MTKHNDYRDEFPVGTLIKNDRHPEWGVGTVVDIGDEAWTGSKVRDTCTYKNHPLDPWANFPNRTCNGDPILDASVVSNEDALILSRNQPWLVYKLKIQPEPECSCDIKSLVSNGCTCQYSKWKRQG